MDAPKDLVKEIKDLEEMFTVDTAKLKQITNHFVGELERGLSVEGGDIVSFCPWIVCSKALPK